MNPPIPQSSEPPGLDLASPSSVNAWERSDWNVLGCKMEVRELRWLVGALDPEKDGKIRRVGLRLCGAFADGVADEQLSALQYLIENEKSLFASVREAIYTHYREHRKDWLQGWQLGAALYGDGDMDINAFLPEVKNGTELDRLVMIADIYISRPVDGSSQIGIELNCVWDDEHGLGVCIADGKIKEVGGADVAYVVTP